MPTVKKESYPAVTKRFTTLNLGCGTEQLPDALNVDIAAGVKPDLVHDLTTYPYPFPDNQFSKIICKAVLEHLPDVLTTMKELVRVAKDNAVIIIEVPHFSSANAHTDITHQHFFGIRSMDYFTEGGEYNWYTDVRVNLEGHHVTFPPHGLSFLGRFIYRHWWKFWETNLHGLIPAENLTFTLRVKKS
jgi:SAM-dependent methyltransferase